MKRPFVYQIPGGEWAVSKHVSDDEWECAGTFPNWPEALGYGNRIGAQERARYLWL